MEGSLPSGRLIKRVEWGHIVRGTDLSKRTFLMIIINILLSGIPTECCYMWAYMYYLCYYLWGNLQRAPTTTPFDGHCQKGNQSEWRTQLSTILSFKLLTNIFDKRMGMGRKPSFSQEFSATVKKSFLSVLCVRITGK